MDAADPLDAQSEDSRDTEQEDSLDETEDQIHVVKDTQQISSGIGPQGVSKCFIEPICATCMVGSYASLSVCPSVWTRK